ncbi:MAG: Hsp20/alpha crystallin family protein [Candidatus Omnitrophota bacterium]
MKKFVLFASIVSLFMAALPAYSAPSDAEAKEAAAEQARQEYRIFLQQLKELTHQYREVTQEVQKVIREEGLPTIDENTGELRMRKGDALSTLGTSFGDADIKETDKDMVVKIDLPGVKKEEIKVSVENGKTLRIRGERDSEKEEKKDSTRYHYYRSERQVGRFERLIELPMEAKDTGMEAKYENGVLTVRIPKASEKKKEVAVPIR